MTIFDISNIVTCSYLPLTIFWVGYAEHMHCVTNCGLLYVKPKITISKFV